MCASRLLASRLALSSHTRRVSAALSTRSRADGCARLPDTFCGTLESGTQGGVPASNLACRGTGRKRTMYARGTNIRFPPSHLPLYRADEHDVELPSRAARPQDLRSECEDLSSQPEQATLGSMYAWDTRT